MRAACTLKEKGKGKKEKGNGKWEMENENGKLKKKSIKHLNRNSLCLNIS
jgi:hypothetical protein